MSKYFPKPYEPCGGDINVKVDLPNYATKKDTSSFALKSNLANLKINKLDKLKILPNNLRNLKTKVDKLDIDKLVPVPIDLSNLSDAVKIDVVKKTVYNKLVAKVNNINTSGFVLKTKYDTDKSEIDNKILDTSGFVEKADYDDKISEIESKIPTISGLTTTSALTAVENKIHVSSLVKKQIKIQKLVKLKKNLLIIIMTNILLLQNLISLQQIFLMKD